jgi:acyl-coenzyme A thioesterase PaaI-like protein
MDDPRRAASHHLADELRRIIDRLTVVDAPADELEGAAEAARAFGDRLDELLPHSRFKGGYAETALAGSPMAFFDRSPLIGLANPIAPPIRLEVVEKDGKKWVEGTAVFGRAYEGPPGNVHGGFVAAAFDEVLGFAQSLSNQMGMTGTLTIRYRSPTPLFQTLSFRAWVEGTERRKIFVSGTCHAGERLTAEADGIFISIDPQKFLELREQAGE